MRINNLDLDFNDDDVDYRPQKIRKQRAESDKPVRSEKRKRWSRPKVEEDGDQREF